MVLLTGENLHLEEIRSILYKNENIDLDTKALSRVQKSREAVERIVSEGRTVYGINTGFGKFSDVSIDEEDVHALQRAVLRHRVPGTRVQQDSGRPGPLRR